MIFATVFSTLFLNIVLTAVFGLCPPEWLSYSGSCYKYTKDVEIWPAARANDALNNWVQIAIETEAEQNWFSAQARTFNHTKDDQGFWLGATDFSKEGRWQWIYNNGNFTDLTYSIWGKTQPNNRDDAEHCMAAVKYFNYSWSDERCDYANMIQYVCEMREPVTPVVVG